MSAGPEASCDVVVIGAGPAGISAALRLHRAGRKVCVLERSHFPRFAIGESLLPRCRDHFEELGLLDTVESANPYRKSGALFLRRSARSEFSFAEQFTPGSKYAWHVRRAEFDHRLAERARAEGVAVYYGQSVDEAQVGSAPRVRCTSEEGVTQTIDCRWILDASGGGRVLARMLGLDVPSQLPARRAVYTHLRSPRLAAVSESHKTWAVHLSPQTWCWLIPFGQGEASFGIVGALEGLDGLESATRAYLERCIREHPELSEHVGEPELLMSPRLVPGYASRVSRLCGEGYALLGNAADFVDPIFSSGVTVALESARCAAELVNLELEGREVDWQREYADYIRAGVDVFREYVRAWYSGELLDIFFAAHKEPIIKKQICSVLAGYAWDRNNPFVRSPARKLAQIRRLVSEQPN